MKTRYCDDWACKLKWSCRHHFVRSRDYWAMSEKPCEFWRGHRTRWGCFDYEADRSKPWLNAILFPGETMIDEPNKGTMQ